MNGNTTTHAFEQKNGSFVHAESPTGISPILVLIIILLAAIFFVAGLAHLLMRFFIKRRYNSSPTLNSHSQLHSHGLQGQLRQLFRLHDSGLDQAVIEALPVFRFEEIGGPSQPFDCAVCLSEFCGPDELRLLPPCSHAFHAACIDTWLLANSTCPLCRRPLLVSDLFADRPTLNFDNPDGNSGGRVFPIRLGKFKSSNGGGGGGESSRCNMDARRCYSMGTFQYVLGEANLQVTLRHESEAKLGFGGEVEGKKIGGRQKGESFSVSKIWLWSKNGRFPSCSDTDIHLPTSLGASFRATNQSHSSEMVRVE